MQSIVSNRARRQEIRKMAALVLGFVLSFGGPAAATPEYVLPTLFDVADVASDDVLNIRAAPDPTAPVIGTLAHDARNIEVVGMDASGRWAQVNTGEQSGWAAFRYLAYQVDVWRPETLPASLRCYGTEPFWSVAPNAGATQLVLSRPDAPNALLMIQSVLDSGLFRDPRRAIVAKGDGQELSAVILPAACSDGMSDRAFGLDATVILQGGGSTQMLTGCCSVAPR
jgi:uncharacterized membrane protein